MTVRSLGSFVVQHRYTVHRADRDRALALLARVRDYAADLGLAHFEVWVDEDAGQVTELHGYDSWNQYQRLQGKDVPAVMREVYAELERVIEGGWDGVDSRTWQPTDLPD